VICAAEELIRDTGNMLILTSAAIKRVLQLPCQGEEVLKSIDGIFLNRICRHKADSERELNTSWKNKPMVRPKATCPLARGDRYLSFLAEQPPVIILLRSHRRRENPPCSFYRF